MGPKNNTELLETWKEIADYLDKDVRTCMRWSKDRGLPVKRISDSKRARVYAIKPELDEWLQNSFEQHLQTYPTQKAKKRKYMSAVILVSAILAFLIFFISAYVRPMFDSAPVDFKIEKTSFVLLNKYGRELNRLDTGVENLIPTEEYKRRFNQESLNLNAAGSFVSMEDLNSDGETEILFSVQTKYERDEGDLFCLDRKGHVLWSYSVGREIRTGNDIYADEFRIMGFRTNDYNHDGQKEIAILSAHLPHFPSLLTVLNHKGEKLGEYWNSGHMMEVIFEDINNDGKKDLVVAGMNNEYLKGCLIVFDLDDIHGASPQFQSKYSFKNMNPGTERYYILFPRTKMDEIRTECEAVVQLSVLSNSNIYVLSQVGRIIFILDSHLYIQSVRFSDDTRMMLKEAQQNNLVSQSEDELIDQLKKGILYYNGTGFVSEPSMSHQW